MQLGVHRENTHERVTQPTWGYAAWTGFCFKNLKLSKSFTYMYMTSGGIFLLKSSAFSWVKRTWALQLWSPRCTECLQGKDLGAPPLQQLGKAGGAGTGEGLPAPGSSHAFPSTEFSPGSPGLMYQCLLFAKLSQHTNRNSSESFSFVWKSYEVRI